MIIEYNPKYFDCFIDIIMEFISVSEYKNLTQLSEESLTNNIDHILSSDNHATALLIKEGNLQGFIFGVTHPCIFANEKWCQELAWYVRPKYRGGSGSKLLEKFEEICVNKNVDQIVLSVMYNEYQLDLIKKLKAKKYVRAESSLIKRL